MLDIEIFIPHVKASFQYRLQIGQIKSPAFVTLHVKVLLLSFIFHRYLLNQFANRFTFFGFDGNCNDAATGEIEFEFIPSVG